MYARSKPAAIHWGVPIDMTPAITPPVPGHCRPVGHHRQPGRAGRQRHRPHTPSTRSPTRCPGAKGVIKLKTKEMDEPRIGSGPLRAAEQVHLAGPDRPDPGPDLHRQALSHQGHVDPGLQPHAASASTRREWLEALKKLDFVVVVDLFHDPHHPVRRRRAAGGHLPGEGRRPELVGASADHQQGHGGGGLQARHRDQLRAGQAVRPGLQVEDASRALRRDPQALGHDLRASCRRRAGPSRRKAIPARPTTGTRRACCARTGSPAFRTPSGKVELYSTLREEWGLEPLPHHEEPPFTPVSRPELLQGVPADPVHRAGGRRSTSTPSTATSPGCASSTRIRWWRSIPRPQGSRHRQRRVGVDRELAGPGQIQGQGDPDRAPLDGHGHPRLVVPGEGGRGAVAVRRRGSPTSTSCCPWASGQGRPGRAHQAILCRVYKAGPEERMTWLTERADTGLLIDYEYCTGCHTCEVACAQEYDWPAGMCGMRVRRSSRTCPRTRPTWPISPFPRSCASCAAPHQEGTGAGLRAALHGRVHEVRAHRGPGKGDGQEAPDGALGPQIDSQGGYLLKEDFSLGGCRKTPICGVIVRRRARGNTKSTV